MLQEMGEGGGLKSTISCIVWHFGGTNSDIAVRFFLALATWLFGLFNFEFFWTCVRFWQQFLVGLSM